MPGATKKQSEGRRSRSHPEAGAETSPSTPGSRCWRATIHTVREGLRGPPAPGEPDSPSPAPGSGCRQGNPQTDQPAEWSAGRPVGSPGAQDSTQGGGWMGKRLLGRGWVGWWEPTGAQPRSSLPTAAPSLGSISAAPSLHFRECLPLLRVWNAQKRLSQIADPRCSGFQH